ncbi:hypothetical protein EAF04_003703 [Stromatinia cepivora]|nr:hypothetical protein EAF04_003703 [Stromatinia cepivora]
MVLKPERKQWILPQTKAPQTTDREQIISAMKQWQSTQKKNGNWYNIPHTVQKHESPGIQLLQLDEPLWSRYNTLRATAARNAAAGNVNNINMNNATMMEILQLWDLWVDFHRGCEGGGT